MAKLQWNFNDKINQYQCVEKVLQLKRAKYVAEFNERKQRLKELLRKVMKLKLKLKNSRDREFNVLNNLLKGYKIPMNFGKSLNEWFEECDTKLSEKRKKLNRLKYEIKKLSNAHASKLMILSKMQNSPNFIESYEERVKNLAFLLGKSIIQIRTYENLLNDCKNIINYLSNQSVQYEITLKSLEHDLKEQNKILNSIKNLQTSSVENKQVDKKPLQIMTKQQAKKDGQIDDVADEHHETSEYADNSTEPNLTVRSIRSISATGEETNELDGLHDETGGVTKAPHASQSKSDVLEVTNAPEVADALGVADALEVADAFKVADALKVAHQNNVSRTLGSQSSVIDMQKLQSISGALSNIKGALQRFDDMFKQRNQCESLEPPSRKKETE